MNQKYVSIENNFKQFCIKIGQFSKVFEGPTISEKTKRKLVQNNERSPST